MTSTAVLTGNDQRINFFNLFVRSRKTTIKTRGIELTSPKTDFQNPVADWFEKSSFLVPVEFQTIRAGEIFKADRLIVKFKLSDTYRDQFVLLRGLLSFSRPKEISISANNFQKTFELHLGKDQAEAVTTYLDKILDLLTKEIKFKKSLKAVLRFEQSIKLEQAKLYKALGTSVQ